MKKVWLYISAEWQTILLLAVGGSLLFGFLTFRLGSLTPGAHGNEVAFSQRSPSVINIVQDPVNSPYVIVRNIVRKAVPNPTIGSERVASTVFGLITVLAFYGLLSLWYRPRVALLGTLLLASSSWFLHSARFGTPHIAQALSVSLILFWAWLQRTNHPRIAFALSSLAVVSLLYIPGMIWFVAVAALWRGKQLRLELRKQPASWLILCAAVGLILMAPLLYSLIDTPSRIFEILGVSVTQNITSIAKEALQIPQFLAVRGPTDAMITVGRLPLLDMFTALMVVVGAYATLKTWRLDRNMVTIGLVCVGIILTLASGSALMVPLLIPIYLLATAGVAYMLEDWLSVFPRNPLARAVATTLMSVAVLTVAFYHVSNYFIAWPNAPETRATFSKRL